MDNIHSEQSNTIISKILFPILITSKKTKKIVYANPYAQKQYETNLDTLIGMEVSEFYTDENQREKIISSIKEDGKVENLEMSFKTMKGNIFYGLLSLTDIVFNNEDCFMGMVKDITLQKEQEQKLARQSKMEALGEMISNIAHHWRQPLSAISLASSGIVAQHEFGILDDECLIESMEIIDQESQFLSKTLDSFRDMIADAQIEKEYFNINLLIKKVISNNKYPFEIFLDLDEDVEVYAAMINMEKSIKTILNNSKDKFEIEDIKEKIVILKTKNNKYSTILEFLDNAGGMDESILDKIYEPYFTTSHMSKGKGLSLFNTHKFITVDLKGTIDIKNKKFKYNDKEYLGVSVILDIPIKSN